MALAGLKGGLCNVLWPVVPAVVLEGHAAGAYAFTFCTSSYKKQREEKTDL